MPTLELDDAQAAALREVLGSYLSDLRMQIANTDSMDYRERLKKKEAFLKDLIGRLGP